MYFMEKLNVYYEQYKNAERIELELADNKWPERWTSGNKRKTKNDWKEDFNREILTVYPQFKEYCFALQCRTISLEDELLEAKRKVYELEERLNKKD